MMGFNIVSELMVQNSGSRTNGLTIRLLYPIRQMRQQISLNVCHFSQSPALFRQEVDLWDDKLVC